MKTKALGIVALGMMIGGMLCLVIRWDGDWERLGTLAVVSGGQLAVTAYFAGKRGTIDDAFQAGYEAGFHKGERARPRLIRLDRERAARR